MTFSRLPLDNLQWLTAAFCWLTADLKWLTAGSTWTNQPVGKGSSALGVASWSGHKEMATLLLAHEASPNLAGSNGDTPVTCCSRGPKGYKVIDILVSHGACVAADQPSGNILSLQRYSIPTTLSS